MALREFRDAHGVEWRVWATFPEANASAPGRRAGLGELEHGWLTFECTEGRRRLAPFPADWDSLPDEELARWCSQAKTPPPRRSTHFVALAEGRLNPRPPAELTPLDPAAPARTFTGASGRLWRVTEHECTVAVGSGSSAQDSVTCFVLRFVCETEVLELRTYPMAWARLDDAQLLRLARRAERVR